MSKELADNRRREVVPVTDIWKEDDHVILRMEMPGVTQDGLEVEMEKDELRISGRRAPLETEGTVVVRERRDVDFRKVFALENTIDRNRIDAEIHNGVLTVRLAIKESEKPRKIAVKTA